VTHVVCAKVGSLKLKSLKNARLEKAPHFKNVRRFSKKYKKPIKKFKQMPRTSRNYQTDEEEQHSGQGSQVCRGMSLPCSG
jgi:hypothetical protein